MPGPEPGTIVLRYQIKPLTSMFCLSPAYSYSVENQTLADALERQQSRVHHIYSSIAGETPPSHTHQSQQYWVR